VLCLASLLSLTLVINKCLQKRGVPIPEAIVTVVIGIIAGGVDKAFPAGGVGNVGLGSLIPITTLEKASSQEFMIVFIAPIIFAEGYALKSREFFENLARILTHAFVGTLVSSIVVAVGLFYVPGFEFSLAECLTFGALISATDPVSTLAIFKEQKMVESGLGYLYYSVLGESILNDAVAITLFTSFGNLVKAEEEMDVSSVATIAADFLLTFLCSLAIGVAFGLFTALVLKMVQFGSDTLEEKHVSFNIPELGFMILMAYVPFLVAEAIHFSGIVAVMFAGITMRRYAHYNMTQVTRQVFLPVIELLANLCETYVFFLLGLGVFLLENHYSKSLICWTILLCLVARAMHVYPFTWVVNRCSSAHKLNVRETHVVWYAGLRGAVAFMCALNFPQNPQKPHHRGMILCDTVILVGATLIFFGWPTEAVLRLLNIRAGTSESSTTPSSVTRFRSREAPLMRFVMTHDAIAEREKHCQPVAAIASCGLHASLCGTANQSLAGDSTQSFAAEPAGVSMQPKPMEDSSVAPDVAADANETV